jgi:hypothetical protein
MLKARKQCQTLDGYLICNRNPKIIFFILFLKKKKKNSFSYIAIYIACGKLRKKKE